MKNAGQVFILIIVIIIITIIWCSVEKDLKNVWTIFYLGQYSFNVQEECV